MTEQELAKARYHYDPETGVFTYIQHEDAELIGKEVGHKLSRGHHNSDYLQTGFQGKNALLHRLAWLYMTGEWPKGQIDHIDGNGLNNAWANLRDVSGTENQRNIPLRKNNKSGLHGVRQIPNGRFRAKIGVNGEQIWLGTFADFFEACCARKSAENRYGFHANHGRSI